MTYLRPEPLLPGPNNDIASKARSLAQDIVRITGGRIAEHQQAIQVYRATQDQARCTEAMLADPGICSVLPKHVIIEYANAAETELKRLSRSTSPDAPSQYGVAVPFGVTGPATATMMITAFASIDPAASPEVAEKQREIQERYLTLPAHRQARELAKAEISRLRLDDSRQQKQESPSVHLENAWAIFDSSPLDRYSTQVLIPIRSCIKACIDALIARRPRQERTTAVLPAPMSILQQAAVQGSLPETWHTLSAQYTRLQGELSSGKEAVMTRDQIRAHLCQATSWLAAFLREIDVTRLRAP
jgi:hypothetical protein